MRHRWISTVSFFTATAIISLLAGPGYSDLLTTTEDQLIDGTLVGYRNDSFRFESNGQVKEYPADQVKSITVSAPETGTADSGVDQVMLQQMSQSLAALHQRMDALQYQIEQMSVSQDTRLSNIQQRAYDLNPVSRMVIEGQRSSFDRRGDFIVQGHIRNNSGVMVYNPEVRIDLVGPNDTPIMSEVFDANVSSVGPNSRAPFRARIPKPPKFEVYYVTPVLTRGSDPRLQSDMEPAYLYNRGRDR
jgi:hypothetical protein